MSKVIHIEICKSYKSNKFNIKIGDISGSTESSNTTKMEVLEDISDEIDEIFPEPSQDTPEKIAFLGRNPGQRESKGCGKKTSWAGQEYLCGQMEDLKHSSHIILCKDCRKKSFHEPEENDVWECECGHDDNCHENFWGICNVVGCRCTKFSKKSKSEIKEKRRKTTSRRIRR